MIQFEIMNHLVFPTLIYSEQFIKGPQKLSEIQKEALQIRSQDLAGLKWSRLNYATSVSDGYTSYASIAQLQKFSSTFSDLEKKINSHVKKFCKARNWSVSNQDIAMTDCWLNVMPKGLMHSWHLHPHSVVSGTVYIQCSKNAGGCIQFEDPRLGLFMNAPHPKNNSDLFLSIQPKAGQILLFDSWLKHQVLPHHDSADRISVSFNYGWKHK